MKFLFALFVGLSASVVSALDPPAYTVVPGYTVKASEAQKAAPARADAAPSCSCAFGCRCYEGKACECLKPCPCDGNGPCAPVQFVSDPKSATVRIDLGNFGGSGTVIWTEGEYSLVLTNEHVGKCPGNITVTHEGKKYEGHRGAYCGNADLAIIWVKAVLPVAELAESDPDVGQRVRFWGRTTPYSHGEVTGQFVTTHRSITATYTSEQGDSGAGVFDDKGRLVGVHWGKFLDNEVLQPTSEGFVPVSAATLFIYEKAEWFPRLRLHLKDRIAAKKLAKMLPENPVVKAAKPVPKAKAPVEPPKVVKPSPLPAAKPPVAAPSAPFSIAPPKACPPGGCPLASPSCPGGKCPAPSRRGLFGWRR